MGIEKTITKSAVKFVMLLLSFSLVLTFLPETSFAQVDQAQTSAGAGPRKKLATIIFSGLAGAILGLSTLSFYGRPQDRLSNIAVGFAVGIISGTVFTTYQAATQPQDLYAMDEKINPLWADNRSLQKNSPTYQLGYEWSF